MSKRLKGREKNWRTLLSFFPTDWEGLAGETKANARLRGFRSVEVLMRTLLLHVARGYSLRETVVRAKLAGLANVSDVTLLKRLRSAEGWFQTLCVALLQEQGSWCRRRTSNWPSGWWKYDDQGTGKDRQFVARPL